MRNRLKILEINGFRGLLLVIFIVGCAISGFVLFPSWFLMQVWNAFAAYFTAMPTMQIVHGAMLWAIIVLSVYAANKDRVFVSCKSPQIISDEQIKEIVKKTRMQSAKLDPHSIKSENKNELTNTDKENSVMKSNAEFDNNTAKKN